MENAYTVDILSGLILLIMGWGARILYERWEPLFISVQWAKNWVINPTALWDVEISYTGGFRNHELKESAAGIQSFFSINQKLYESTTSFTILAEGINISAFLGDIRPSVEGGQVYGDLTISMKDIRASFREARELIGRVAGLLETIDRRVKYEGCKYSATIHFRGGNPYFGLFVRRIRARQIDAFNCVFHVPQREMGANTVVVSRDNVGISTDGLTAFQTLSLRYLALSPRLSRT